MAGPAFLFDLDGTLIDSVYQHVLAWRDALVGDGIDLAVWRIHRRIGMSGGLFGEGACSARPASCGHRRRASGCSALARRGRTHEAARPGRPLPGASCWPTWTRWRIAWAIATSGENSRAPADARGARRPGHDAPLVTRDQVAHAKPDPDLFLAAAERLGVDDRRLRSSWATASGTCWPPAAHGPGRRPALRRLRPRTNWSGGRLSASTRTRPICSCTSTRSACARPARDAGRARAAERRWSRDVASLEPAGAEHEAHRRPADQEPRGGERCEGVIRLDA